MTVIVELLPDIEAGLSSLAAEQALSLADYVRRVPGAQVPGYGQPTLSPAERAAALRQSVKGPPRTGPLSDDAIRRESFYGVPG